MTAADLPSAGAAAPSHSGRLGGRARFAAVRACRASASAGPLTVHGVPNGLAWSRIGLATPGIRGSVVRNRVRRRLREALRKPVAAHPGLDLVVRAGADSLVRPFAQLAADADSAVSRVDAVIRRRAPAQG